MGGVSHVGVPGGLGALREEDGWPAPTMLPVLNLRQLSRLVLGCTRQGWWDRAVMAAATELLLLQLGCKFCQV